MISVPFCVWWVNQKGSSRARPDADSTGRWTGRKGDRTPVTEAAGRIGEQGLLGQALPENGRAGAVWLGRCGTDSPAAFAGVKRMKTLFCQVSMEGGLALGASSCLRNMKKLGLKDANCGRVLWRKFGMVGSYISLCFFV